MSLTPCIESSKRDVSGYILSVNDTLAVCTAWQLMATAGSVVDVRM